MRASKRLACSLAFCAAAACGGVIDTGDSGPGVDSGADVVAHDSPPFCKPDGQLCGAPNECCAKDCNLNGVCGTCVPDTGKCTDSSQCCSQLCNIGNCVPNAPPPCLPPGAPCTSPSQCCANQCSLNGTCGGGPPPPPPCQPSGTTCTSSPECCSNTCVNNICANVSCGTSSTKLCDQCVNKFCCGQWVGCTNDTTCTAWLSCIQSCEQNGFSAFACTQNKCGPPVSPTENALYLCAQQNCNTQCTTD